MKVFNLETKDILDYEKEIGLELEVRERRNVATVNRYYAHFKEMEIMENHCLISVVGDGPTINEAIEDYCKRISNKDVAINPCTKNRVNITTPTLIYIPAHHSLHK